MQRNAAMRDRLSPQVQKLLVALNVNFLEPGMVCFTPSGPMPPFACGIYDVMYDFISVTDRHMVKGDHAVGNLDAFCLHEIIHWTGHPSRLGRPCVRGAIEFITGSAPSITLETEATEELAAQMGMVILFRKLGLDYVKAEMYWLTYSAKFRTTGDLTKATEYAEAAVAFIVDSLDAKKELDKVDWAA